MQHAIDDQHRGAQARRTQPVIDRLEKLNRMAACLQFEANLLGEVALVFDDQNRSARSRSGRLVRSPPFSTGEAIIASLPERLVEIVIRDNMAP